MNLTTEQQIIFNAVESTTKNYFVTGKPGVGKSVLINSLVTQGRKTYTLAAPTGLAALNISGRTLHSLFNLPISHGVIAEDYNVFTENQKVINNIKYNIRYLIIDEISMVRADMFDFINRFMKFVKDKDEPFGGVQVIVVGDFFQLPPIVTGSEVKGLAEHGYNSPFVFSSKVWTEGKGFRPLVLSEVLRQKGDNKFIKILHNARTGSVTIPECTLLNKQVSKPDDLRVHLCGTNPQADQINMGRLRAIQDESYHFEAIEFGKWPAYPCEKLLTLKVGAQVMIKKNGADVEMGMDKSNSKIVNGTLGIVERVYNRTTSESTGMDENGDPGEIVVEVRLENGELTTIYKQEWQHKIKERNLSGDWEERVVASFEQMPLALAWAISIHKSQGQSFDKVLIDPSKVFAAGQLYVAISRGRSLKGVAFTSPVSTRKFWADKSVIKFYESNNIK